MLKAVIFDMDGLMVDTEIICFQVYKQILKDYNYDLTLKEYVEEFAGKPMKTSIENIKKRFQVPFKINEGIDLYTNIENNLFEKNGVSLKEGVIELLEYLKEHNYKIVIATSSLPTRAKKILKENHITHFFDDMVFGTDIQRGKPFPDIFLKACEKLNIKPNEALVLEDSEAGIQAAYNAHIPVICIPDLKYPQEKYVKQTIKIYNTLLDVIPFIEKCF